MKVKRLHSNYKFEATDETEVDLYPEEAVIEIQPDEDGWTLVRKGDGSEGFVPTEYLGIS